MFTGIVEEVGTIERVEDVGNGRVFRIACRAVPEGMAPGDSVAVDGACLTVTAFDAEGFAVEAVETTLGRTTFGGFEAGRRVNLERAVALGARLGGHLVQGHVDGLGTVTRVEDGGEHLLIDFTMPDDVAAVTVLHGSITVNGISLTVNDLPAPGTCQVSIIPYTREHTTVREWAPGDAVNLEGDTIGKYVRHLLGAPARAGDADAAAHLRGAWGYR